MRKTGSHPEQVLGLKDSSGDIDFSAGLARRMPTLAVFPSAEAALAKTDTHGFAGCISATANITSPFAAQGWTARGTPAGETAIAHATAIREALSRFPLISCVKWALADLHGNAAWRTLCPPLRSLTRAETDVLAGTLARTTYSQLKH